MTTDHINKGIIEPAALPPLLGAPNVKVIDGTFTLPGAAPAPYDGFLEERIESAVFFDIKEVADKTSSLPHMLPDPESFAAYVSGLGISSEDMLVIYGQSGMVMGPARVWWMFRTFGHENICVLNGGLPAWRAEGYPVVCGEPQTSGKKGEFNANKNTDLVRHIGEVMEAQANKKPIFDARPRERFHGTTPEPREGLRAGHIPGSKNVPAGALVDPDTGKLKTAEELQKIFDVAGFTPEHPPLATCGSGVTACVIALALFNLGYKNVPVYDGSWSEWGLESCPTEVQTA